MRPEVIDATATVTLQTRTVVDREGKVTVRVDMPSHGGAVQTTVGFIARHDDGFWVITNGEDDNYLSTGTTKAEVLKRFTNSAVLKAARWALIEPA